MNLARKMTNNRASDSPDEPAGAAVIFVAQTYSTGDRRVLGALGV